MRYRNRLRSLLLPGLFLVQFAAFGQSELIRNRLANVQGELELSYHSEVQRYIDYYAQNKENTGVILGKSAYYVEMLEDSLEYYGVPSQLKFLAAALSGYDNWTVSPDGGSGFWQLRYLIARRYGLKMNSYVDERREFDKATGVAARYLRDLHKNFKDWNLVVAAFYSDEVEVNKAIRKSGGKTYWDIHNSMPDRHRKAVPAFTAMVYMHFYHDNYKVRVQEYEPVDHAVVHLQQWSTIYQLSQALECDYDELKELNPLFKKQVIPHTQTAYPVRIPLKTADRFAFLGDSIYTYPEHKIIEGLVDPAKEIIPEPRVVEPAGRNSGNSASSSSGASGKKAVYYTVRRGDFLGRIADMYDVGVSSVRKWNGIRGDRINAGQRLKIYVPASRYSYYSKINSMSAAQKRQIINRD